MLKSIKEVEDLVYHSYVRAIGNINEKDDAKVKKPELTRQLFQLLGSPDKGQRFILVTGSKGKGSTSRMIASILGHLGLKVGLFTSPHLVHFNERIRINGKAIEDDDYIRISNQILEPVRAIQENLPPDQYIGPIGINLAIAVLYFKENKTDINVIECGRGGQFDDTNILQNEYAVITPVMEEHLPYLGPTLKDIVSHKIGIVKKDTKAVFISEQIGTLSMIKDKLKKFPKVKKAYYNIDFLANHVSLSPKGTQFNIQTNQASYQNLALPLLGTFQAVNAATAVNVCEDIIHGPIPYDTLSTCLQSLQWPGRCEVIDHNPTVILDGTINRQSALYLQDVLHSIGSRKIISIVGVPADKDYKGVIRVLSEFSSKIIVTKPDISHLIFPEDAGNYAKSLLPTSCETSLLVNAIALAKEEQDTDTILIAGTQTLIANAKRLWNQSLLDIGI